MTRTYIESAVTPNKVQARCRGEQAEKHQKSQGPGSCVRRSACQTPDQDEEDGGREDIWYGLNEDGSAVSKE
jgi:hypothetical protein